MSHIFIFRTATIAERNLGPVAVKVFRKELKQGEISQREKDSAYEELLKLAVLDHENIVKLHGMVQDGKAALNETIHFFK